MINPTDLNDVFVRVWRLLLSLEVSFNNGDSSLCFCNVNTAFLYMLIASTFFALSGVAVHGLGNGYWDVALLSRALFGLPFALFAFYAGPRSVNNWRSIAVAVRSVSAVVFLAMLYFMLEYYPPGESFTLASMRPLWVAGLAVVFGTAKIRFAFWPLSMIGVVGIALMEGSSIAAGLQFIVFAFAIGLLGGMSTFAIDYCKGQTAKFLTLHLTLTMLVIALCSVFLNQHAQVLHSLLANRRDLLLYSIAGLGGTLYQIFSVLTVKKIGSVAASAIALMSALFAWILGHLIWKDPANGFSVLGIVLAMLPCAYMVLGGNLTRKSA